MLAQAADGLLLPIVAGFLPVVMKSRSLLGQHRNGTLGNTAGALVLLVATGLAIYQLADVFGLLPA